MSTEFMVEHITHNNEPITHYLIDFFKPLNIFDNDVSSL